MRYSLHITAIPNQRAHTIVAHNLAGNRNVSLSFAQSLLETFPVVYMTDLTGDEAAAVLRQLTKIGVKAHAVASDSGAVQAIKNNGPAPSPAPAAPSQVATPPSAPAFSAPKAPFIFKQEALEQPSKRRRGGWKGAAVCASAAAALLAAGVLFAGRQWRLALRPDDAAGNAAAAGRAHAAASPRPRLADSGAAGEGGDIASEQEKIRAQAYVDSAKGASGDEATIAFYKIAISFNKHNADAWYGLVHAYERCGKTDSALAAREEMKRLFGEAVFRLPAIVGRYGTLIDYHRGSDGTFRIEYRSRSADSQALVMETYQIVKAFGALCQCAALSLHVSGPASRGMLVFIKTDAPGATFDQFKAGAVIKRL